MCRKTFSAPLGKYQRARIFCYSIWKGCIYFGKKLPSWLPKWPHHFAFPLEMNENVLHPHQLFCLLCTLDFGHSNRCGMASHCYIILCFSNTIWCRAWLYMLMHHVDGLLCKLFVKVFHSLLIRFSSVFEFFVYSELITLYHIFLQEIFSLRLSCLFIFLSISFTEQKFLILMKLSSLILAYNHI